MTVLFAVNGRVQVDNLIVPLGEPGHLHGGAVGDLLIQTEEQLLPDNLGADLPLGLVRDHVLREELGSLGDEAREDGQ